MAKHSDLTDGEFTVLDAFMREGPDAVLNGADISARGRISRPGAREAMSRLIEKGLLEKHNRRARNQKAATLHARLLRTPTGVRRTWLAYLETLRDSSKWRVMGGMDALVSPYGQATITPDLVCRTIAARGSKLFLYLPDDPNFTEPESEFKRHLPHNYAEIELQNSLEASVNAYVAAAKKVKDPGSRQPTLPEATGQVVHEIVLPFLSLIKASPSALRIFLADWKPHDDSVVQPLKSVEHVLFRLIFAAIGDLAQARYLPQDRDVTHGAVCPDAPNSPDGLAPLLVLRWLGGPTVAFRAQFDTDEMVVGDELVVVENNPENCWVHVWCTVPSEKATRGLPGLGADLAKLMRDGNAGTPEPDPYWLADLDRYQKG